MEDAEQVKIISPRLYSMDAIRGIGMLIGILIHITVCHSTIWSKFWITQDSYQHIIFDVFILIIRCYRMEIFFLMAGLFAKLMLEKKGDHYFIQNRIIKILIPFIIFEPLMLILIPLSIQQPTLNNMINSFKPFHLWFLYYLILFYSSIYFFKLIKKIIFWQNITKQIDQIFNKIIYSKFHILILTLITFLLHTTMTSIIIDFPMGFAIKYRLLLHYGIFFYFGWFLKKHFHLLDYIVKNRFIYFIIAMFNIVILIFTILKINNNDANLFKLFIRITLFRLCYSCCTWCLVLSTIGFVQHHLNKEYKLIRYLSASSYWLYIMHLPLVFFLQNNLFNTTNIGFLKPIFIFLITIIVLLISYHAMVKTTFLKYFVGQESYNNKQIKPTPVMQSTF